MKNRIISSGIVALGLLIGAGNAIAINNPGRAETKAIDKAEFRTTMRKLWEDHIVWTRLYIISALGDLPDKDATTGRLLQNQTDIGNAIKPLYGDAAGSALTALLRDHILIAADLISAVKTGDAAGSKTATERWDANADQIAEFLSKANPRQWGLSEMKMMMHSHLSATTAEVVARLKHDWTADVRAYDEVHGQILEMADMLSSGIISQFPSNFK